MQPCSPQVYRLFSRARLSCFFIFLDVFRHYYITLGRSGIILGQSYNFSFIGWSLVSWRRGVEASTRFPSRFIDWLGLVFSFSRCRLVSDNDDGKLEGYWMKGQSDFSAGYRRNREETSKPSLIFRTRKIIQSSWCRHGGQIFYYGGRSSFRWCWDAFLSCNIGYRGSGSSSLCVARIQSSSWRYRTAY